MLDSTPASASPRFIEGVRQPIAVNAKLRNLPEEAIFNWEPQGQIGIYRPDTFFYGG